MLADGGEAIADLAVLRDQAGVFGPVASTPTAWRLLADTDEAALASLRAARGWLTAAVLAYDIGAGDAGELIDAFLARATAEGDLRKTEFDLPKELRRTVERQPERRASPMRRP